MFVKKACIPFSTDIILYIFYWCYSIFTLLFCFRFFFFYFYKVLLSNKTELTYTKVHPFYKIQKNIHFFSERKTINKHQCPTKWFYLFIHYPSHWYTIFWAIWMNLQCSYHSAMCAPVLILSFTSIVNARWSSVLFLKLAVYIFFEITFISLMNHTFSALLCSAYEEILSSVSFLFQWFFVYRYYLIF